MQASLQPLAEEEVEAIRQQLDARLKAATEGAGAVLPAETEAHGRQVWQRCEALTAGLVGELAEQLRLILEPTLASRLAGDYRTGKRINMKKVGGLLPACLPALKRPCRTGSHPGMPTMEDNAPWCPRCAPVTRLMHSAHRLYAHRHRPSPVGAWSNLRAIGCCIAGGSYTGENCCSFPLPRPCLALQVIGYIASSFRKDKIWLRRTRPDKRRYQVVVAVDNSRSMAESGCGAFALEALTLICRAMSRLEVGELGVVSFGGGGSALPLHALERPFTDADGVRIMSQASSCLC